MSPGQLEEESDEARMEAFKPFMTGNALVFGTNIHPYSCSTKETCLQF